MRTSTNAISLTTLVVVVAATGLAQAADTTETFGEGEFNVEVYALVGGLSPNGGTTTGAGELVLGLGIVEQFFSAFAATAIAGGQEYSGVESGLSVGVFSTPVDTNHVDLDIILSANGGGAGLTDWNVAPAIELNFDTEPDLAAWGVYLRAGLPITGSALSRTVSPGDGVVLTGTLTIGAYWTISGPHQVLVQYDQAIQQHTEDNERTLEVGGASVGYNVALSEVFELVTDVFVDIPQAGEQPSVAAMVGVIVTL